MACSWRLWLSAWVTGLAAAGAAGQSLLVNGGFETPGTPLQPAANTLITLSAGQVVAGFGWQVLTNNVDVVDGQALFNWGAVEGSQFLDLHGTSPPTGVAGSIAQTITTTAGTRYRIRLQYSSNPLPPAGEAARARVTDLASGVDLVSQTLTHGTSTANSPDWRAFTAPFVATGTQTRVSFQSLSGNVSSNGGIVLDDISVRLAPQPTLIADAPAIPGAGQRVITPLVAGAGVIRLRFSLDVVGSGVASALSPADLEVTLSTPSGSAVVPASGVTYDAATRVATVTLPAPLAQAEQARVRLLDTVTANGETPAPGAELAFARLIGDLTQDAAVAADDLAALTLAFGLASDAADLDEADGVRPRDLAHALASVGLTLPAFP